MAMADMNTLSKWEREKMLWKIKSTKINTTAKKSFLPTGCDEELNHSKLNYTERLIAKATANPFVPFGYSPFYIYLLYFLFLFFIKLRIRVVT